MDFSIIFCLFSCHLLRESFFDYHRQPHAFDTSWHFFCVYHLFAYFPVFPSRRLNSPRTYTLFYWCFYIPSAWILFEQQRGVKQLYSAYLQISFCLSPWPMGTILPGNRVSHSTAVLSLQWTLATLPLASDFAWCRWEVWGQLTPLYLLHTPIYAVLYACIFFFLQQSYLFTFEGLTKCLMPPPGFSVHGIA